MAIVEGKFGVFIENQNIVLNIFGEKAKIKIANLVLFIGIALILLTQILPKELEQVLIVIGVIIIVFVVIVLGHGKEDQAQSEKS